MSVSPYNLSFTTRMISVPFEIVSAGDHWSRKMSRQMEPLALMFGW